MCTVNFNDSNTNGAFTMPGNESIGKSSDSSRKQIFRDLLGKFCCVYSLESPHRGDSNEYAQDVIILFFKFFVEDVTRERERESTEQKII